MAKAIIMPKFGFTQETAQIVTWLKKEGDTVEAGDPIAEVTTDKINMEVEATGSGILSGLRYKEGDVVPVTEVIAYLLAPGEKLSEIGAAAPAAEVSQAVSEAAAEPEAKRTRIQATPVAERVAREKGIALAQVTGSGPGGRVMRSDVEGALALPQPQEADLRATPAARRIARELNADLHAVPGSGPRGRVQGDDVRQWTAQKQAQVQATAVPPAAPTAMAVPSAEPQVVPLSNIRRTIGERLQRSAQESPHIYFDADIDVGALEELRKRGNARQSEGQPRISMTALLLRMVAWALARHPMVNSQLSGDNILLMPEINLGVAVAAESGLIVPVVHNVERKSVTQLASELDELVARARQNRLRLEDVSGGTFTISNLGMFGVDRFTAIINPPQVGILAVGRSRRVFVPDEHDQPVARSMMTITLSVDHRIVDGAMAARFLADLRECLEHPELVLL